MFCQNCRPEKGVKVIAEGVETEDQLSFFHSKECDESQGFLFSKPVPAKRVHGAICYRPIELPETHQDICETFFL